MPSQFILTAQIQLQAPRNSREVIGQIERQLGNIDINLELRNGRQSQRQLDIINNQIVNLNRSGENLGRTFGVAIRRFTAFAIATRAVSLFTGSLTKATEEAIDFEREIVKIAQVTGKTVKQLNGLKRTITDLSTSLGVSSKSILSVGRILSQAGVEARDLEVALTTLAKTELAPTFEDIEKTAEGAVAILAQFGEGVGALERQLGAINAVAGQFAVESGDLISVVRRTGGVFQAAGGELEELLGLFTSVRATTRESAESIATGLRTIFTRIQRPKTIEFLKQFGVELIDLEGKFVGPFDAVRQLSVALAGLERGDIRFVQIAEELGGFRQIGKVIPLLQQFETAERARQAALEGGSSLTKDAATAQQALAVQITKVKEEFLALVRGLTETSSFQILVKTSLELASALIKIADALKPLLPLLASFAAFKLAQGIGGFARGIGAGIQNLQNRNQGGKIHAFATGGVVPGTGNRDTVPAMLTPGEFVIRKSSVESIGSENLARMNSGGVVQKFEDGGGVLKSQRKNAKNKKGDKTGVIVGRSKKTEASHIGGNIELTNDELEQAFKNYGGLGESKGNLKFKRSFVKNFMGDEVTKEGKRGPQNIAFTGDFNKRYEKALTDAIDKNLPQIRDSIGLKVQNPVALNWPKSYNQALRVNDPDLVGKTDLINWNQTFDGKKGLIEIPGKAGEKFKNDPDIRNAIVKEISSLNTDEKNTRNSKKAFDIDSELNSLKGVFISSLEEKDADIAEKLLRAVDFQFRGSGAAFRGKKRFGGDRISKQNFLSRGDKRARKAFGGLIQKFATGGGVEGQKKNAYIFDFDDTLATTEAKGFKEFSDPKFVKSALATRYASLAKRRASQGDDVHVLTARSGGGGIREAIAEFMASNGIATKSIIAVGKAFPKDREPGKRPGTTRKLSTASKKAKVLSKLSQNYGKITFLDDNAENLIQASKVKGVSAVEAQASKLSKNKKAFGGLIQKFENGGTVKAGDLRRGDILNSGQVVRGALSVGNRTKRRVSLTLEKDGDKKTETVDFFKKFELKSRGKAIEPIKLFAGGIVDQKAAGAAILDPEPTSSKSVSIGVEDVKKKFSEFSKLAKGKDPVSKFYKSTSFDVTKSGLNKETSDKFKAALEDGLVNGINTSTSILANDLGTPNAKIDKSQTSNFIKSINAQVFGRLFETTVDSISRQGNYDKPDNNPDRPFDAEQGLPSGLKDNFKGLPNKFIDLKTSAAAASDANLKGKILDQIKIELISDGILNTDFPGKAGKDKEREKQSARKEKEKQEASQKGLGFPVKRNKGGDISGSDTVPALLTPGEFVVNKEAAQRIGYGNLSKMNQQGMQGFNKGGPVGGMVIRSKNNYGILSDFDLDELTENDLRSARPSSSSNRSSQLESLAAGGQINLDDLTGAITDLTDAVEDNSSAVEDNAGDVRGDNNGGNDEGGEGRASRRREIGLALSFAATSLAGFVPQVEGATEGFGAVQNSLGPAIAQFSTLAGLGAQFGPLATNVAGFAGAAVAGTSIIDAYTGVHEKAKAAIEEGNVAQAGAAAAASKLAEDQNKAAIGFAAAAGAIGSQFGLVGQVIGGVVGAAGAAILKLEALQPVFDAFRNNVLALFGADSTTTIAAKAEAEAAATKATKALAEQAKETAEALKEIERGEKTFTEAFKSGDFTSGIDEAVDALKRTRQLNQTEVSEKQRAAEQRAKITTNVTGIGEIQSGEILNQIITNPFSSTPQDITGGVKGLQERAGREAASKEVVRSEVSAFSQNIAPDLFREFAANQIATTGTIDDNINIDEILKNAGEGGRQLQIALRELGAEGDELKKKLEAQAKAIAVATKENLDFIKALNFGTRTITSNISAFSTELDGIIARQTTGFSEVGLSTKFLSAAISEAGVALDQNDIDEALDTTSEALRKFGATDKQVDSFRGSVTGLALAQKNASAALDNIKKQAESGELDLSNAGDIDNVKDQLREQLLASLPKNVSDEVKNRLLDSFNKVDLKPEQLQEFLAGGDSSAILESAFGPVQEAIQKQFLDPLGEIGAQNDKIAKLTEKRVQVEQEYIKAQRAAIDVQLEAAKAFEFFGGEALTAEQEFGARRAQANLSLRDAGVQGLTSGSVSDIRRASDEIFTSFKQQEQRGATTGFSQESGGIDADKRDELKQANEALLQITKQGIEQRKQELELIRKKNEAEKKAIDSLLSGDIESFFDQAIGAAAGQVLAAGDAQAASLFGAGALGRGLQGIQGTGLSDDQNQRAAELALSGFGINDPRAAQVFTGTTPEEEQIKAEGRELAALSGDLAQQGAGLELIEVQSAEVTIAQANIALDQIKQRSTPGAVPLAPQTKARGGIIYANTGMFVPRGTDTVPAMLTPGEFVVNRAAVQRGNNLQLLQAMNGNTGSSQALSKGGTVYRNNGSVGPEQSVGFSMPDFTVFTNAVDKFSESINKLEGLKLSVKLDTTNVNVNFNGGSFLSTLKQEIKTELLNEVANQIPKAGFTESGELRPNQTGLV